MDRKRKRKPGGPGRKDNGRAQPGRGRRTPPPDGTGLEDRFLRTIQNDRTQLGVCLRGGVQLEGTVERFDAQTITFDCGTDGERVVRKSEIRYLLED